MKKAIIATAMSLAVSTAAMSQDIYNEVRSSAKATVESPTAATMLKQIAQFKVDALDYMVIKMREQMPDSSTTFLDKQAVALSDFTNLFLKGIIQSTSKSHKQQIDMVKAFMNASYSNPLFNDTDTELTLSYYSNADCLTRFSLDTDWPRATAAVISMNVVEQ